MCRGIIIIIIMETEEKQRAGESGRKKYETAAVAKNTRVRLRDYVLVYERLLHTRECVRPPDIPLILLMSLPRYYRARGTFPSFYIRIKLHIVVH